MSDVRKTTQQFLLSFHQTRKTVSEITSSQNPKVASALPRIEGKMKRQKDYIFLRTRRIAAGNRDLSTLEGDAILVIIDLDISKAPLHVQRKLRT